MLRYRYRDFSPEPRAKVRIKNETTCIIGGKNDDACRFLPVLQRCEQGLTSVATLGKNKFWPKFLK